MSFHDDIQSKLFSSAPESKKAIKNIPHTPLAERIRPKDFSEFAGQDNLLMENQALRQAIETDQVPSLILWGPPGSGKTTLAGIIAQLSLIHI